MAGVVCQDENPASALMLCLTTKYLLTAAVVVLVSEAAKRSGIELLP